MSVVLKPANFIQKGEKNSRFGMCNIYNEETTFYSWKKVFFFASWYWHIHRFLCFRKEEDQNVQRWQLQVFHLQKRWREKFDCPVHQIQMCKKRQDSFRVCSFYIHGRARTESCTSSKLKVDEVWCQYHIGSHKRWKICR